MKDFVKVITIKLKVLTSKKTREIILYYKVLKTDKITILT